MRDGYYGVYCHKDENEELYDLIWNIFDKAKLRTRFKYTRFWAMWRWLDGQLINWDSEILKKIPNGELAEQIFELWKPLLDTITDNLDKITKLDIKKS